MKAYNKYIRKDIKQLFSKLMAIVLIVALGVGISVGLFTTAPNMRYTIEKYYDETNASDLIVQGFPFDEEKLNEFKNHNLIESAEGYFSFDQNVDFRNGTYLSKINIVDFESSVNKLKLIEGRLPNKDSDVIEIVVERKQPFLVDVPLGYETTFNEKLVKVVGVVQSPWYFAFVEEISVTEQRPIEIIIYANDELHLADNYTHINVTLKDIKNNNTFTDNYQKEVEEIVKVLENEFEHFYFQTRNLNESFAKYKSDIKVVEVIALIFPMFFLLVTVLVSMSSVTRIVEDQRTQIGTLRSLGYSKFRILGKYIFYALLASGLGVVLGIGLGIYFIPAAIYNAYTTIYNLPIFKIQYYWSITSIISVVMILSVTIVTISYVLSTLKEKTIDLLKIKVQKPGKKVILERIPFIWKRLKFKYKSTVRNIFRHKKNLILMLIGIGGSTALLLTGLGIKDSIDKSGTYQYDEMTNYQLEITTNKELFNYDLLDSYEYELLMSTNASYKNNEYITLVIPNNSDLINNFIKFGFKKDKITFDNKSVIVTQQFADKHDIKINDYINLKVNDKQLNLKVTNIQQYYFGNNIYISKEVIQNNIDFEINKIYVKVPNLNNDEISNLKNELELEPNITKVMTKTDMKYSFQNTSDSMYSIIILLVFASVLLAVTINYNLLLINIHTRQREIATLKVLGYQESEVSGYVFRETLIITFFAILLGLLIGKGLHFFIITQIIIDGMMLYNAISYVSYIITFIVSLLFLIIVYLMSLPQTRKIDMIDALKSFE